MNKITSALLVVGSLTLLSFNANARVYKLATNVPSDGAPGQLLTQFAEAVDHRTEGRVSFRIYWNGTLGGQEQYIQQVQSGVIDAGLINSGTLENLVPQIGVLNLPYIFRSTEEFESTMTNPEVTQLIQEATSDRNLNTLGFLNNGFRSVYTTKNVQNLDDLKGLKIRTVPSDTYIKTFRAFGAVATPMDFSEIYSALQQGVIDGAEGGLGALWELNFGEVTKYAIRTEHTRLTDFVLASPRFTKRVGEADYQILQEEFDKVSIKSISFIEEQITESENMAMEKMNVKFTSIDKDELIERIEPLYEEAQDDSNKKELINKILTIQNRS
ncbi:C4-dicarboxylate ABC transporter [Vibrio inusitatus NBRC 102082]|uniref:C4-dicarboxylate ABC transporter n=1 Tax=Vibrio inusitatus NBRC 102082 TaxID=1219070 RepID=A0A4Y3HZU4_9VIBR|nr:TRAP transporter substrate-binding protein DctP [Vibrio inusitatus]GEA52122.1 C4-dicarboxylate ABC transporter [Vibrio inusitatus NBRC 102082]